MTFGLVVGFVVLSERFTSGPAAGAVGYLTLAWTLRNTLARQHRQGMALVKRGQFEAALPHFAASYDFFRRHPWVDAQRHFTLLSPSRVSYCEMALVNQAFCHAQLGWGSDARRLYEQALAQFPGSNLAQTALRMLDAGRDATLSGRG